MSSAPLLGPTLPVPPLPPRPRPVSQFGEGQAYYAPAMHKSVCKASVSDELDETHDGEAHSSSKQSSGKEKQRDACCDVERNKQEILDLMRVFKADVGRVLSQSLGIEPADVWGVIPTTEVPKSSSPIEEEPEASRDQPMEAEPEHSPPPSPIIHSNIICDLCQDIIIGVRHKCLDCPGLVLLTTPKSTSLISCVQILIFVLLVLLSSQRLLVSIRQHTPFLQSKNLEVYGHTQSSQARMRPSL